MRRNIRLLALALALAQAASPALAQGTSAPATPGGVGMARDGSNATLPTATNNIINTPPTCDGFFASDAMLGVGSKNFSSATATFAATDVGKLITVAAAGSAQNFSNGSISAAGTGYVPGQTITLTGGAETSNAVLDVLTTKVVSATVAGGAGGTGGTPGTQTVTGTTGTGTLFTASVTVSGGGAITAVLSITTGGKYTVNPTTLATEPVTGAGLVGAQLNVVMGINTVGGHAGNLGSYTVTPANPVAQGSSSGSGTGATVTANWMGTALVSSIATFTDAHDVVLANAAVSTVSGGLWGYGTDYYAKINAALAAGVLMPKGSCGAATMVSMSAQQTLLGQSAGTHGVPQTTLMWLGPAGGTQLSVATGGAVSGIVVGNFNLEGLGSAAIGASLKGLAGPGTFVYPLNAVDQTTTGIIIDSYANETQSVTFEALGAFETAPCCTATDGISLGPTSNVNHNHFHSIHVQHANGRGLVLGNTDSNDFGADLEQQIGGTGLSLALLGSNSLNGNSRSNIFKWSEPAGGITAYGTDTYTFPSANNWMTMNTESEVITPTYGTGAILFCMTEKGVACGPSNANAATSQSFRTGNIGLGGTNWLNFGISNDGFFHFKAQGNSTTGFIFDTRATAGVGTIFDDGGWELGAPTGGDEGLGTLNATGLFINGVAVSTSAANMTVGTSTITSGTTNGLLYDNAGVLGNLATGNSGVLITSGAGVPSISTTLPSGLTAPSLTVTTAFTATGLVTNADLAGSIAASKLIGTDIATVGALSAGSIAAGFGTIATANTITTSNSTASTSGATGAITSGGGIGAAGAVWAGTFMGISGTTLPTQAAGTLGLGGIASAPTFGANGEGDIYLSTTAGLVFGGDGSATDLSFTNSAGTQIAYLAHNSADFNFTRLAVIGAALTTPAAGTLALGGEASVPTMSANGEAALFITSTTGGVSLMGKGSTNDRTDYNAAGSVVCVIPTGTTNLSCGAFLPTGSTAPTVGMALPAAGKLGLYGTTSELFSGATDVLDYGVTTSGWLTLPVATNLSNASIALPGIASSAAALDAACWNAGSSPVGILTHNGAGALCSASLEELKDIFGGIDPEEALNEVMVLKPIWAKYKDSVTSTSDHAIRPMFGAHQVESVDPRLAAYDGDGRLLSVEYLYISALNTAAIQGLHGEIAELQNALQAISWQR